MGGGIMSVEDISGVRFYNDSGDAPIVSYLSPAADDDDASEDSEYAERNPGKKAVNRLAAAAMILGVYLFSRFAGRFSYDCTECEHVSNQYYSHRIHRTACRTYCAIDTTKDGYLSKSEFWNLYKASSNGNSVPEDVFVKEWAHVTGMCDQEGLLAFDLIADLGNGNPIDDEAFHAAFNILCSWTFCNESRGIMESAFPTAWNQFYELIEDEDNCMLG